MRAEGLDFVVGVWHKVWEFVLEGCVRKAIACLLLCLCEVEGTPGDCVNLITGEDLTNFYGTTEQNYGFGLKYEVISASHGFMQDLCEKGLLYLRFPTHQLCVTREAIEGAVKYAKGVSIPFVCTHLHTGGSLPFEAACSGLDLETTRKLAVHTYDGPSIDKDDERFYSVTNYNFKAGFFSDYDESTCALYQKCIKQALKQHQETL